MKPIAHPFWGLLTILLPVAILCGIFGSVYHTIHTSLDKETLALWKILFEFLAAYSVIQIAGLLWVTFRKTGAPIAWGIGTVMIHVFLLYELTIHLWELFPNSVPNWVASSDDYLLYAFTFLMPGVVWGMGIAVVERAKRFEHIPYSKIAHKHVIALIAPPILWYAFFALTLPLFSMHLYQAFEIVLPVFICLGGLVFFFAFSSILYAMLTRNKLKPRALFWGFLVPVFLILPLIGLLCNWSFEDIFGDFTHPLFTVTTVVGALLYLLPTPEQKGWKTIALFVARSALYSFYVYFFLVFLPFLPVATIAIIAIGTGFLMLAPVASFLVATQILGSHYKRIAESYSKLMSRALLLIGICLLPMGVLIQDQLDRHDFQTMMHYVYESPDQSIQLDASTHNIQHSLDVLLRLQEDYRGFGFGHFNAPFLTPFYNWWVFDQQTLSQKKTTDIYSIWDEPPVDADQEETTKVRDSVAIQKLLLAADSTGTWVHIRLHNQATTVREYFATISIPANTFVDNFYLDVDSIRKYGTLAERKSAMWVYQNIRNTNRDPGLLRYSENSSDLELRVFPLLGNQERSVGFHLVHTSPVDMEINGTAYSIPANSITKQSDLIREFPDLGTVVDASALPGLQHVVLPSRYHFILDASARSATIQDSLIKQLQNYLAEQHIAPARTRFTIMNSHGITSDAAHWEQDYRAFPKEGGLFLERALKHTMLQDYRSSRDTNTIFVLLSNRKSLAYVDNNLNSFAITHPGTQAFYEITARGTLYVSSFSDKRMDMTSITQILSPDSVALLYTAQGNYPLPLHQGAVLIPYLDSLPSASNQEAEPWTQGARLALWELRHELSPAGNSEWQRIVEQSFRHHILGHATSFLVVENAMQEQAMLNKQKEVLAGQEYMSPSAEEDEETQMSEPGFWFMLALALGLALNKRGMIQYKVSSFSKFTKK